MVQNPETPKPKSKPGNKIQTKIDTRKQNRNPKSSHQGMVESDAMALLADALDRAGAGDQPLASTLCQVNPQPCAPG